MNKTNVKTKPSTTHRHDTPNNKTHIIIQQTPYPPCCQINFSQTIRRTDIPTIMGTHNPSINDIIFKRLFSFRILKGKQCLKIIFCII